MHVPASRGFKSPATWLFIQQFAQTDNEINIKVPHQWLYARGGFPSQKSNYMERVPMSRPHHTPPLIGTCFCQYLGFLRVVLLHTNCHSRYFVSLTLPKTTFVLFNQHADEVRHYHLLLQLGDPCVICEGRISGNFDNAYLNEYMDNARGRKTRDIYMCQ